MKKAAKTVAALHDLITTRPKNAAAKEGSRGNHSPWRGAGAEPRPPRYSLFL